MLGWNIRLGELSFPWLFFSSSWAGGHWFPCVDCLNSYHSLSNLHLCLCIEWLVLVLVQTNWRRPKGIDSRVRRKFKGCVLMPNIGYGSDKKTRHYLPNGFKKFVVHNAKELEILMMHNRLEFLQNICSRFFFYNFYFAPNIRILLIWAYIFFFLYILGLIVLRLLTTSLPGSGRRSLSALHSWTLLLPTNWLGCVARRMNEHLCYIFLFICLVSFCPNC